MVPQLSSRRLSKTKFSSKLNQTIERLNETQSTETHVSVPETETDILSKFRSQ